MTRLGTVDKNGLCLVSTPRIAGDATVREGLLMISKTPGGMLVVHDQGRPAGVLTDVHLARLVEQGCNLWEVKIKDVMRPLSTFPVGEAGFDGGAAGYDRYPGQEDALELAAFRHGEGATARNATPQATEIGFSTASLLDELSDVGVIVTSADGFLLYYNKSVEAMIPELSKACIGEPLDVSTLWKALESNETQAMQSPLGVEKGVSSIVVRGSDNDMAYMRVNRICGMHVDGSLVDVHCLTDVTEIFLKVSCVEKAALYDSLTNLPNRSMFVERLHREIKRSKRYGKNFTVLVLDLDNFKDINDRNGHLFGDACLMMFSKRLSEIFRESDTIARIGGDEFTIILPEINDMDSCKYVVEKIMDKFDQPVEVDGVHVRFRASIGCAIFPLDGDTYETLFSVADARMYSMKRSNKA